ncbi:MAG: IS110 family transposase [Myxococcales bacterium]|nr:IS110 family transposase [Myxococcales bacterium]
MTAITLATELGTFARFTCRPQVMSYTGLDPSEHSSGARDRRGAITKAGNAHLRRVLVEAAWHYGHRPKLNVRQEAASGSLTPQVAAIAWKAQERLHRRFFATDQQNQAHRQDRHRDCSLLVGFIWAIGVEAERKGAAPRRAPEQ